MTVQTTVANLTGGRSIVSVVRPSGGIDSVLFTTEELRDLQQKISAALDFHDYSRVESINPILLESGFEVQ